MRDEDLRILLEHGGDLDRRHILFDGIETLQRVGAEVEVDLAGGEQDAVVGIRAAGHDGHVEAVFPVGTVGERLIEAAMLALRHPIGAECNLVEGLGRGRRQPGGGRRQSGEQRADDFRELHCLLLRERAATIEHDPEKSRPRI